MHRPRLRWLLALAICLSAVAGCSFEGVVRARAASDFGCDESEIQVEEIPGSTYRAAGCGQTGEYTCTTRPSFLHAEAVCVSDNSSSRAEPATPSAAPPPPSSPAATLHDPPPGAGGFLFGASEDTARETCEQAGHKYTADGKEHGWCDGVAADVGAPASATLAYCAGKLCAISLKIDVDPQDNVARTLARWKTALSGKYGAATASQANIPDKCSDDVTPCLLDGSGSIRIEWQWPSRQRITLSPQVDASRRTQVRISYVATETVSSTAPGL